jgi:serine O-acetyltransferase
MKRLALKQKLRKAVKRFFYGAGTEEFWSHREKCLSARNGVSRVYHKLWVMKILRKNNAMIPEAASISGRIAFPHGLSGIFISQGAVIGKNCTLFHQVTIGSNTLPDTKNGGAPVLGNSVFVGAGAKIIGGIKIGNNVRIGANCVVVEDVPDNATVVMQKPRVIVHERAKENSFAGWTDFKTEDKNSPKA